jgi:NAD(P)-dependent dehydrogenase (short-subunit alcohol dehydrogenase family)
LEFFQLAGRRFLVTGASSGLGAQFAQFLSEAGAAVVLAARRLDHVEKLARDLSADPSRALGIALDVRRPESVDAAFDRIDREFGPLDGLVNNAGLARQSPAIEATEDDARVVLDTNLLGCWRVARRFALGMIAAKRSGLVVNVASVAAQRTAGQLSLYCASKAGLEHMTRCLATEWARYGIRVNALSPGYVLTDINREFFESEAGQAMVRRIPLRRLCKPEDLRGPLLLLCSDAGRYMTGSCLVVDGGHSQAFL